MSDQPAREASFLFLRCPAHRGRRRRQGLKTTYRPGTGCEACRLVQAGRDDSEPAKQPTVWQPVAPI